MGRFIMTIITKCLNEWNATIEALGEGKQTILIRKYSTSINEFIFYPTTSYALHDDFTKNFKTEYQSFVKENSLPRKEGKKSEVKYVAKVEKVLEKPNNKIGGLNKYHIWTNEHVKAYLRHKKAYIWILRVYKLKRPVMSERTSGLRYANLLEGVSLEGIKPVLSDSEFFKVLNDIS